MTASTQASGGAPSLATTASESLRVLVTTKADDVHPAVWQARRQAAENLIGAYGTELLHDPRHTIPITLPDGSRLSLRLRRGRGANGLEPGQFVGLEPASHFTLATAAPVVRTPGVGVPLVATLRPVPPVSVRGPAPAYPVAGFTWAVTAVPVLEKEKDPGASRALDLDLYDPHPAPGAVLSERSSPPLATDYTTPAAITLAHLAPQNRDLRGFLDGGSQDFASCGIYTCQPPSPNKIPVVLVHGLVSDPTTFHLLEDALENDPEVRARYQLCFFYYPSSLPVPYSAMLLREDLAKFIQQLDPHGAHPAMRQVVLVGHSMGGLLCRLDISDGGDTYYHHFFRKPLDQLDLTTSQRNLLRRAFYYRANPDVKQVVFIATPHRGSKLTGGLLGGIGHLLVRLPVAARTRVGLILARNKTALAPGLGLKPASSMNSLTPSDPLISAVNEMPMRANVGLHSVIGNRGRPSPLERSSDGVVPYTSSHLPQAQSETIVPADHSGTLREPRTAAEIIRVLHGMTPDRQSSDERVSITDAAHGIQQSFRVSHGSFNQETLKSNHR